MLVFPLDQGQRELNVRFDNQPLHMADGDGEIERGSEDTALNHTDHFAFLIEDRATGIARIHRGVELDPIQLAVSSAQR